MTDRYARLRAALDSAVTGASDPTANWLCVGGHTVMLNSGRPVWARIAACEHRPNAAYIATCDPGTIRALLADYDRMRDALRWTAAALQESCRATVPITEGDLFFVGADVRTAAEILNAADAALAQEGP